MIYIVGAGPGDADLLTLRALRILERADVILHDRLVSADVLAMANPAAQRIYVGKHAGEQEEAQAEICRLLLHYARRFDAVVRLKGGDPMVFGRGAEEWAYLVEDGLPVELVPGVSSAVAVPALAGIPLTCRGVASSFAVAAGHCRDGENTDWEKYAGIDTLVILMGVKHRRRIAARLIAAGRPSATPAAFVERGATRRQRVVTTTLGAVAQGAVEVRAPAVFVIGEVVAVRGRLAGAGAFEIPSGALQAA